MTDDIKTKIMRCCKGLKKDGGYGCVGYHRLGGWDTRVVASTMEKHGIPRRFRPDVMDALGAGVVVGRGQTVDRGALKDLAALVADYD